MRGDRRSRGGAARHRADARKVKAFIRSLGRLAKTDRIDAEGLTRYGQERAAHRRRLTAPTTAPTSAPLRPHLEPLLAQLADTIAAIDAEIETVLAGAAELRRRRELIQTMPGCGRVAATALVALLPEFGHVERKAIASLAGLAPHPRQSGQADRYRRVRGGRSELRRLLFMAALSASRHHPGLRAFYQGLVDRGKKKIVAITAVMRKLLTILNAQLRDAMRETALATA